MPKILISDAMDSIAEKILTSNNIDVDVKTDFTAEELLLKICLLYTSPSPRDRQKSRMPSSA